MAQNTSSESTLQVYRSSLEEASALRQINIQSGRPYESARVAVPRMPPSGDCAEHPIPEKRFLISCQRVVRCNGASPSVEPGRPLPVLNRIREQIFRFRMERKKGVDARDPDIRSAWIPLIPGVRESLLHFPSVTAILAAIGLHQSSSVGTEARPCDYTLDLMAVFYISQHPSLRPLGN